MHEWMDLWMSAETWKINEAVMGFRLVEHFCRSDEDTMVGYRDGKSFEYAEAYMVGSLKFDSCINVSTMPDHFCGMDSVKKMMQAFERLYEVAAAMGLYKP